MPKELTALEEFDLIMELQFPDFVYSIDSMEEQIAFSKMINILSSHRIMMLYDDLFDYPFVIAGLQSNHIETLIQESELTLKKGIIFNLSDPEFLNEVGEIIAELDRRDKTTENSTRLKNILQYLKDNKYII